MLLLRRPAGVQQLALVLASVLELGQPCTDLSEILCQLTRWGAEAIMVGPGHSNNYHHHRRRRRRRRRRRHYYYLIIMWVQATATTIIIVVVIVVVVVVIIIILLLCGSRPQQPN